MKMNLGRIYAGKKGVVAIAISVILGLVFLPFVIGGALAYVAYLFIPQKAVKYSVVSLVLLLTLFIGSAWSFAMFSGNSGTEKTQSISQKSEIINISPTSSVPSTEAKISSDKKESPIPSTSPVVLGGVLVTRVVDGDTIELESGERVRYIGVDTPETVDPRKVVQCFGKEASKKNAELVLNQRVRLEKDASDKDKYGRLLRYVYVGDTFMNDYLVREGFAKASSYPPDVKFQDQFRSAEQEARQANRGLWSACPVSVVVTASPILSTTTNQQQNLLPSGTCLIKGNISTNDEKIYHVPGCRNYDDTKIDLSRGERYFCSESEAVSAGWRKAKNCP